MELSPETVVIVTGGAGFIGSNLIRALNEKGVTKIIVVDNFDHNPEKWKNLVGLNYHTVSDIGAFYGLFEVQEFFRDVDFFVHLGGRADTREDFGTVFELNYKSSLSYMSVCSDLGIPFFYASSAATYGNTTLFSDHCDLLSMLEPNNAYGLSKHMFDLFLNNKQNIQTKWCGMKFFNVFGPGEMHKGEMASIIGRALNTEQDFEFTHMDGWERDFIYIDDVIEIILFLITREATGIFNVGSGESYSWEDVYKAIIEAVPAKKEQLELIKNPKKLPSFFNNQYQKYSKADISRLRDFGYEKEILSLTNGVKKYYDFYQ